MKKNVKYNILYVCDTQYLQKKMSRVRFWAIEHLSKHTDVQLYMTGPGFINFNSKKSLQENIIDFNIDFNLVIWYKPLNDNYNFDMKVELPFRTCLRYNEMWDTTFTENEINTTKTNIIVCHHKNDYLLYKKKYKHNYNIKFIYIPHHADPNIFKLLDDVAKDIDILISGVIKKKHYPFKYRLNKIIMQEQNKQLKQFKIYTHKHPSYVNEYSFMNINQIKYNEIINRSKICIACASKYNYRLGKYVEIPMAGSVIIGDLPYEKKYFKEFIIEVNDTMTDQEILDVLINALNNPNLIHEKQLIGLKYTKKFHMEKYVSDLLKIVTEYSSHSQKIFIISDEIRDNHSEFKNQKWICDILKEEFMEAFPYETTHNAKQADIIWYLAPWNSRYTPIGFSRKEWLTFLKNKKVICTQHHIDELKCAQGLLDKQFNFMNEYGTTFHAICTKTKMAMNTFFNNSNILYKKLWVNNDTFYHIQNKNEIRHKYNFSKEAYLIGSFQKDTEGKTNLPKLSKGPDVFINIVKDMYKTNNNIEIVLTGLRREYIIRELEKHNIMYHYYNMITLEEINELYNCLDLYIVSSRYEGGPRAIVEAGLTKTPIISTRVGIAPELMDDKALFDCDNWMTYKNANPQTYLLYKNVIHLTSQEYLREFRNEVLYGECKTADKIILDNNYIIDKEERETHNVIGDNSNVVEYIQKCYEKGVKNNIKKSSVNVAM